MLTSVDCGAPYTKLVSERMSGKEELYRGLSQAVTVAVLFVILHDSFRSKLAKQGQRGSESEGARLSIEESTVAVSASLFGIESLSPFCPRECQMQCVN